MGSPPSSWPRAPPGAPLPSLSGPTCPRGPADVPVPPRLGWREGLRRARGIGSAAVLQLSHLSLINELLPRRGAERGAERGAPSPAAASAWAPRRGEKVPLAGGRAAPALPALRSPVCGKAGRSPAELGSLSSSLDPSAGLSAPLAPGPGLGCSARVFVTLAKGREGQRCVPRARG